MACLNHLVPEHQTGAFEANGGTNGGHSMWYPAREASTESLIIGALEAAFWEMDQQIGDDKKRYKMLGKIFFYIKRYFSNKKKNGNFQKKISIFFLTQKLTKIMWNIFQNLSGKEKDMFIQKIL